MRRALMALLIAVVPMSADAVVVDDNEDAGAVAAGGCDGAYTTGPPHGDPQLWWTNSGISRPSNWPVGNDKGGTYLRNGWIIHIDHIDPHLFILDGVAYPTIAATRTDVDNEISIQKILEPYPDVPDLQIASAAPTSFSGELVHMVSVGFSRTTAQSPANDGWNAGAPLRLSWGTNHVGLVAAGVTIQVAFDDLNVPGPPPGVDGDGNYECEGSASGGSGGGLFIGDGATVRFSGSLFSGPSTDISFGSASNFKTVADPAALNAIIDTPNCNNGFDDDGDGQIDMLDSGCSSPSDTTERVVATGGGGSFEYIWGTNGNECAWGSGTC